MLRRTRSSRILVIGQPAGAPAPGPWRLTGRMRRWLILSLVPLAGITIFVTALAFSEDAPLALRNSTRSALEAATQAGAGKAAPEPLQSAESAFSAANREMAVQTSRMRLRRSFDRTRALLDVARRRADLALVLTKQQERRDRDTAMRLISRAGRGFEQMEWLSSYIPPRSAIRSAVRRAHVSRTEALSLYDHGH